MESAGNHSGAMLADIGPVVAGEGLDVMFLQWRNYRKEEIRGNDEIGNVTAWPLC